MLFRRKAYDELLRWKKESAGKYALLIEGARRVGKTTVVEEFAKNEYKSFILIDFSKIREETMLAFKNGISDMDLFFTRMQMAEGIKLYPKESLIVFDEVQLYPPARQMIKHLVKDGRYDYIETGSLISIKKNVKNILIPSEELRYEMYPMDFEEFLWACGDEITISFLKEHFEKRAPLGNDLHRIVMNRYREYMMVGGMPSVVSAYLESKDIDKMELAKRSIINLYKDDMKKIPTTMNTKVSRIFDMIPSFLSEHVKQFKPGKIEHDSRTRDYVDSIHWLKDAKIVNLCYGCDDPSSLMCLNISNTSFKCYMLDTGLLLSASFPKGSEGLNDAYKAFLFGKLPANTGMLFENMVAQELTARGHELLFLEFKHGDSKRNYEAGFMITNGKKVTPIEVKSSISSRHASLDHMISKYGNRLGEKFVIHSKDLEVKGGITYLPIYMTMFL